TAGQMELVPNLEAEWVLDDETLLQCQHFAGIDEARLSDRFGSDFIASLGGMPRLLQFLGVAS
ncbi:unnamed protein product, partial [Effrenium voratum]